jgi:ABC-2 type transport system permease protein
MGSAGVRGLCQAVIVFLFSLVLGIHLIFTPFSVFWVIIITILGAGFFSGLSMIIAAIVKTRERFMGIGQVITLPLFFASNAIYPINIMPSWLQLIAKINPLSHMVDGLRAVLITGLFGKLPMDIGILVIAVLLISLVSSYMYPKVVA